PACPPFAREAIDREAPFAVHLIWICCGVRFFSLPIADSRSARPGGDFRHPRNLPGVPGLRVDEPLFLTNRVFAAAAGRCAPTSKGEGGDSCDAVPGWSALGAGGPENRSVVPVASHPKAGGRRFGPCRTVGGGAAGRPADQNGFPSTRGSRPAEESPDCGR